MIKDKIQELVDRCNNDPYNEVSAHILPNGEVEICLSHRITMDAAVCVRIRDASDIRFFYYDEDEKGLEQTNTGGNWEVIE